MKELFNTYLYQPILSLIIFFYENFSFHDLGVAIILVTILIRIVLFPFFYKSAKDQALMQKIQPQVKQIQETLKNDKQKQATALFDLYKKYKVNPFLGIVLLFIQLPVFFALFRIFTNEVSATSLSFDNTLFLGLIDLREKNMILAGIAALLQYIQGKLTPQPSLQQGSEKNPLAATGKMMLYVGPVLTIVVLSNLPSALGLYWVVFNLFSVVQQYFVNKKIAASTQQEFS